MSGHDITVKDLEQRIKDIPPLRSSNLLTNEAVQEAKGASTISNNSLAGTPKSPSHRNPHARRKSGDLIPDSSILIDLEAHARSISSNIDMVLRDLRGSLRGMSDLTLESTQVFSCSIGSACDVVDTSIRATYTMLAKAEELNSSMEGVHKLAQQVYVNLDQLDFISLISPPTNQANFTPSSRKKFQTLSIVNHSLSDLVWQVEVEYDWLLTIMVNNMRLINTFFSRLNDEVNVLRQKDMKRLLDLFEIHFANESTAFASPATITTNTSTN